MAANPQQAPLSGLARALVQAGRLKEAEAVAARETAQQRAARRAGEAEVDAWMDGLR